MHYSPAAQAHRKRAIVGHEQRFEQFKSELSADRVLAVGHEVMAETLPPSIADEAWASLRRYSLPSPIGDSYSPTNWHSRR